MSSLRDFLLISPVSAVNSSIQNKLAIYNPNIGVQNGGCCCCWVVPAGVTWATFETWSGGGDGAGGCCCQGANCTGGPGNYATRTISVTAADYYCICAAGSGCCTPYCLGTCGFPSWVNNSAGTSIMCASGGQPGNNMCFRGYTGCIGFCVPTTVVSCGVNNYDYAHPAMTSTAKDSTCASNMWAFSTGSPMFGNNTRTSFDWCTYFSGTGCAAGGTSTFPGGGGSNGRMYGGGCCWGGWGAGGLVLITYG